MWVMPMISHALSYLRLQHNWVILRQRCIPRPSSGRSHHRLVWILLKFSTRERESHFFFYQWMDFCIFRRAIFTFVDPSCEWNEITIVRSKTTHCHQFFFQRRKGVENRLERESFHNENSIKANLMSFSIWEKQWEKNNQLKLRWDADV